MRYEDFRPLDLLQMPSESLQYAERTFIAGGIMKWIPATLVALVVDIREAYAELFWIVVLLWMCDFGIGALRAFADDKTMWKWSKAFRSVLKLLVICLGVAGVYLMEGLMAHSGIETQQKLTGAVLIVVGVSEAFSILENFTYFFPQTETLMGRIRELMGKARNGEGRRHGDGKRPVP